MKDIPIIFSAPMILALLDGRKTMTRRLAWRSETDTKWMDFICEGERPDPLSRPAKNIGVQMAGVYWLRPSPWQRVNQGDRLWVRESLQSFQREPHATAQYVADITGVPHRGVVHGWCDGRAYWQWGKKPLPSIHMPRWASRLTLIVTALKVERLQAIGEADALAEGIDDLWLVQNHVPPPRVASFKYLWDDLHGNGSWAANPEVVAISFTVHQGNIDALSRSAVELDREASGAPQSSKSGCP